ncbi:hypothetical protein ACFXKY_40165 [Streptomyces canus]
MQLISFLDYVIRASGFLPDRVLDGMTNSGLRKHYREQHGLVHVPRHP